MTTYIDQTNNPLVIMAIIAIMLIQAFARTVLSAVLTAAGFAANHWRVALLCLVPIVAVVAINVIVPLVLAVLGKLLLGGGLTAVFAAVLKP